MKTLFNLFAVVAGLVTIPIHSYAKDYVLGPGFHHIASTNVTTPNMVPDGDVNGDWNDRPTGYSFTTETVPSSDARCFNMKTTTIDGYQGIKIADGILLVIYNSFASGQIPATTGTYVSKGEWDSLGNFKRTQGILTSTCNWTGSPAQPTIMTKTAVNATANINYGIYISDNSAIGTFDIPKLTLFKGSIRTPTVSAAVINSGNRVIVTNMNCTISAPATVDFGTVNITTFNNNDVLSYRNGQLTINCSGGVGNVATISVTGTKGRYTDTLKMTWLDGDKTEGTPAEIRGFIGNPLPAGECNGKGNGYTNYIAFDETLNQKLSIGELSNGINSVPYSFSLCKKTDFSTGAATANATITVNWN